MFYSKFLGVHLYRDVYLLNVNFCVLNIHFLFFSVLCPLTILGYCFWINTFVSCSWTASKHENSVSIVTESNLDVRGAAGFHFVQVPDHDGRVNRWPGGYQIAVRMHSQRVSRRCVKIQRMYLPLGIDGKCHTKSSAIAIRNLLYALLTNATASTRVQNKSSSADEIPERDVTYHLLCLLIYHWTTTDL